jgi:hypothetical protein
MLFVRLGEAKTLRLNVDRANRVPASALRTYDGNRGTRRIPASNIRFTIPALE